MSWISIQVANVGVSLFSSSWNHPSMFCYLSLLVCRQHNYYHALQAGGRESVTKFSPLPLQMEIKGTVGILITSQPCASPWPAGPMIPLFSASVSLCVCTYHVRNNCLVHCCHATLTLAI